MASPELLELKRSIKRVQKHFVPPSVRSAPGPFSDRIYDRVRALRVLACAEFERYFEERASSIADKAAQNQLPPPANEIVNAALHASYLAGFVLEPTNEQPRKKIAESFFSKDYSDFTSAARTAYAKIIKDNNGVKDANLETILRPIAFKMSAIDPLFLPEMTQFVKQRGEIAHRGVCVTMQLDPKDEVTRIDKIVAFIEALDPVFEQPHL